MAERKLYGVAFGVGVDERIEFFAPTGELLSELAELPKGSTVGIDSFPESYHSDSPFVRIKFEEAQAISETHDISHFYMRSLGEACQRLGLRIVFLDDVQNFRRAAQKASEYAVKEAEKEELFWAIRTKKVPFDEIQVRDAQESSFRLEAEAEYVSGIERLEGIVTKMKTENPDVVVLASHHADYLMHTEGIGFSAFKREDVKLSRRVKDFQDSLKLNEGTVDNRAILGIDLTRRKYNAATKWRILPEGKPDFIGTWNVLNRQFGLFEVYRNGKRVTVEDCLGTATFKWEELEGGLLHCIKRYVRGKHAPDAIPELIHYYLAPTGNGKFEGRWAMSDGIDGGRVIMFEG